jgi:hypothetical protein
VVFETKQTYIKYYITLPKDDLDHFRMIAEQNNSPLIAVLRTLLKKGFEEYSKQQESPEYKIARKRGIVEIFFCQSCTKEMESPNLIKFRDDVFKFCDTCIATAKYKDILQRMAQSYEV